LAEVAVGRRNDGRRAVRIAQVPGQTVVAAVHVAGGAGDLPEPGVLVGVVQVLAADLDGRRGGIEEGRDADHRSREGVDRGDRAGELADDVQVAAGLIEGDA